MKENSPELIERNKRKLSPTEEATPQVKSKAATPISETDETQNESHIPLPSKYNAEAKAESNSNINSSAGSELLIVEHNYPESHTDIIKLDTELDPKRLYTAHHLEAEVIKMETGLPSRAVFDLIVQYVRRFQDDSKDSYDWSVNLHNITIADQVFITLMKIRHNYPQLHLAQLFGCSAVTISNIVSTYISVLHKLLAEDIMVDYCPAGFRKYLSAPSSSNGLPNCKMIIDITDFEIGIPKEMDKKRFTYSPLNSFKCLFGVSPNGLIAYVSNLYPRSESNKTMFEDCGILSLFGPGETILADKGFLIQNLPPPDGPLNIPPTSSTNSQSTANGVNITQEIGACKIHVERTNARLKAFKILSFIPYNFRDKACTLVELVAALVNLQILSLRKVPPSV